MKKKIISIFAGFLFILLAAASVEANNIIKIGGDVTVENNQQADNIIVVGGQATINSLVEQNVIVVGGSVVLTNKALVRGNVVCIGGVVAKGNGAQVFGGITEINSSNISAAINSAIIGEWDGWSWIFAIVSLCFFLAILIFALLIIIIVPRPIIAVATAIRSNKGKSFLWGILGILLVAPLAVLLAVSIIGIPLIPLEFTLVVLALLVGFVSAGSLFGKFFLVNIMKSKEPGLVGATLYGLLLLWLIGWIPYIGWIIKMFVAITGLGGVLLALFNRRERPLVSQLPVNEIITKQNGNHYC